jgi:hypothetical protein
MEETTGTQTIEWLYRDHLQVDEEWSIRTAHGFRWWADRHAQQVEVIGEKQRRRHRRAQRPRADKRRPVV